LQALPYPPQDGNHVCHDCSFTTRVRDLVLADYADIDDRQRSSLGARSSRGLFHSHMTMERPGVVPCGLFIFGELRLHLFLFSNPQRDKKWAYHIWIEVDVRSSIT
jgi:hypothetical protein